MTVNFSYDNRAKMYEIDDPEWGGMTITIPQTRKFIDLIRMTRPELLKEAGKDDPERAPQCTKNHHGDDGMLISYAGSVHPCHGCADRDECFERFAKWKDEIKERVRTVSGTVKVNPLLDQALNEGDGVYRP